MRIYVCGGSAVGKTTFCKRIVDKYGYAMDDEIVRLFDKEWFSKFSLLHRETLFLLSQVLKERQSKDKENIIFDRSILDVVAWMVDKYKHDEDLYKFVAGNFIDNTGVYVITPPENYDWVMSHIDDYVKDPIRAITLQDKVCSMDNICRFAWEYERFMIFEREVMRRILSYSSAKMIDCEYKMLYNYKWQDFVEHTLF